ncbi:MAG: hypothetical protein AYL30_007420 [Candidatus Hecatellales archaeon B24]|nr:MAG: hypothetical protein AYL30_007420 [Candidatus Hecatellales archaeon B24]
MGGKSPREEELRKQGWIRQFTASEPRLSEAVELYESLGYEVKLEPAIPSEANEACRECLLYEDCKTIYTRPKKPLK